MIRRAVAAALIALAAIVPGPADGTAIPVPAPVVDERWVDWPTEVVIPVSTAPEPPERPVAPAWAPTSVSGRALAWPQLWRPTEGVISHYGSIRGLTALPWPWGAGWRVRVCAAGGCIERVSSDSGPERRLHRIADLDVADWVAVCGVPASFGLCQATVQVLGKAE